MSLKFNTHTHFPFVYFLKCRLKLRNITAVITDAAVFNFQAITVG